MRPTDYLDPNVVAEVRHIRQKIPIHIKRDQQTQANNPTKKTYRKWTHTSRSRGKIHMSKETYKH